MKTYDQLQQEVDAIQCGTTEHSGRTVTLKISYLLQVLERSSDDNEKQLTFHMLQMECSRSSNFELAVDLARQAYRTTGALVWLESLARATSNAGRIKNAFRYIKLAYQISLVKNEYPNDSAETMLIIATESEKPDLVNRALDILVKNHSYSIDPRPFYWGWSKEAKRIGASKEKVSALKNMLRVTGKRGQND